MHASQLHLSNIVEGFGVSVLADYIICFNYPFHLFLYSVHPVSTLRYYQLLSDCAVFHHVSLPMNRLQCCSCVFLLEGAYVSEWLLQLCFLCVFVSKCVPDIALFTSPGGPCCHKNSCIIILQQYTKLMTTGYVGQARMTQQTCTRGMLTDNGREG